MRALAVSADGRLALSGSFDQSAILWDLDGGAALQVLRFHAGAVNAVARSARRALPHRRRGRADRGLEAGRAGAGAGDRGPRGAGRRPRRVARRPARRVRLLGRHGAGRARSTAARRACSEGHARQRQRRGVRARRPRRHRRLRRDAADLAEGRRRARDPDAARRRSTASPPRPTARSPPPGPTGSCAFSPRTGRCAPPSRRTATPVIALALSPDGTRDRGRLDRRLGDA